MRNVIWTFFWRPPPPRLRNVTYFSRLCEAHEALLILQTLKLSVAYKRTKVHLGQGQDLTMSIKICLKYKYTYELNAGFCVLCIDDFKILKKFTNYQNFPRFSPRNVTGANPSTPQHPYDVSRGQNQYMTLP